MYFIALSILLLVDTEFLNKNEHNDGSKYNG